jgi:hypothetical protein
MAFNTTLWDSCETLDTAPRTQPAAFFSSASLALAEPGESDEAHAESPDVIFLGGAVQFDGNQVRMPTRQLGENRFFGHVGLIGETEIGVVAEHHQAATGLGQFRERPGDGLGLGFRRRVARGVVGEVEDHDGLLAGLHLAQGPGETGGVEPGVVDEKRVTDDPPATAQAEDHVVVAPELVRHVHGVPRVDEHVGGDAQPVGDAAHDHRGADGIGLQGRVFLQQGFAPGLAQFQAPVRRGVVQGVLGGHPGQLLHDGRQIHGFALFLGDADGGVELLGLLAGLGGLSQYALGKIKLPAQGRQSGEGFRRFALDEAVQFNSQGMAHKTISSLRLGANYNL